MSKKIDKYFSLSGETQKEHSGARGVRALLCPTASKKERNPYAQQKEKAEREREVNQALTSLSLPFSHFHLASPNNWGGAQRRGRGSFPLPLPLLPSRKKERERERDRVHLLLTSASARVTEAAFLQAC